MSGRNILPKNGDSLSVTIEQSYGKCTKVHTVPIENGYFESTITPLSDDRSFFARMKLQS